MQNAKLTVAAGAIVMGACAGAILLASNAQPTANAQSAPTSRATTASPRWRIVASRPCEEWRRQDILTDPSRPSEFNACDSWFETSTLRFIDPSTRPNSPRTREDTDEVGVNEASGIRDAIGTYVATTFGAENVVTTWTAHGEWVFVEYGRPPNDDSRSVIVSRVFLQTSHARDRLSFTRDAETHPVNSSIDQWGGENDALFLTDAILVSVHDNGMDIWRLDGTELPAPSAHSSWPRGYAPRPTPDPIRANTGRAERTGPTAWTSTYASDSAEFAATDLRVWANAVAARYVQPWGNPWAKAWVDENGRRHFHGHWRMDGCERSIDELRIDEEGSYLRHTHFSTWPDGIGTRRHERMMSDWMTPVPPSARAIRIAEEPTFDPSTGI